MAKYHKGLEYHADETEKLWKILQTVDFKKLRDN